jgi:hypothetical protein
MATLRIRAWFSLLILAVVMGVATASPARLDTPAA